VSQLRLRLLQRLLGALTLGNFLSQLLVDGCKLSGTLDDAML
jgi:hypothetical protein